MVLTSVNNLSMNVHFVLAVSAAMIPVVNKPVVGREEAGDSLPASHQGNPGRLGLIPLCC